MTILQEQAVQLIQDMSDDNVDFLIEIIHRLLPQKSDDNITYPSQKSNEKILAFNELIASQKEAKKYLSDNFNPDVELEAALMGRYGNIINSEDYH